ARRLRAGRRRARAGLLRAAERAGRAALPADLLGAAAPPRPGAAGHAAGPGRSRRARRAALLRERRPAALRDRAHALPILGQPRVPQPEPGAALRANALGAPALPRLDAGAPDRAGRAGRAAAAAVVGRAALACDDLRLPRVALAVAERVAAGEGRSHADDPVGAAGADDRAGGRGAAGTRAVGERARRAAAPERRRGRAA